MIGALLREIPSRRLEVGEVPDPGGPRVDEAVIRVDACGICGTDLHIMDGSSYTPELPFVMGHEPVGEVVEAGAHARGWLGRRVTATVFEGCGGCDHCTAADERLCGDLRSILGVARRPGAFAEYVAIPAAQLVPVPDALDASTAAVLVDAGPTAMNAVRVLDRAHCRDVAVVGAGPVGALAAELLRAGGLSPLVVEANRVRRDAIAAKRHRVAAALPDDGERFEGVVECTGAPGVPAQAVAVLRARGTLVLAGYAQTPAFDFAPIARGELTVRGVRSGSRRDLEDVLHLAAGHGIDVPEHRTWPLSQINDAFDALRAGELPGKAVITPACHPPRGQ